MRSFFHFILLYLFLSLICSLKYLTFLYKFIKKFDALYRYAYTILMKKKNKTRKIKTVRIEDDVYEKLVKLKNRGVSFHWAVNEAVRQYLNEIEGKVEK